VMFNPPADASQLLDFQEELSEVQEADFAPLPTHILSPFIIGSVAPPAGEKVPEELFLDVRELDRILDPIDEESGSELMLFVRPDPSIDPRDHVLEPRPHGRSAAFYIGKIGTKAPKRTGGKRSGAKATRSRLVLGELNI